MAKIVELTQREADALKNKAGCHAVSSSHCLTLDVRKTVSGFSRSWVYRSRKNGKTSKVTIGKYDLMTLAHAKAEAKKIQTMNSDELNAVRSRPVLTAEQRLQRIIDQRASITLEAAIIEYLDTAKNKWTTKDVAGQLKRMTQVLTKMFRPILGCSVREIGRDHLRPIFSHYYHEQYPTYTKHRHTIESFFHWAALNDYRDKETPNPANKKEWDILLPPKKKSGSNQPRIDWRLMPSLIAQAAAKTGTLPKLFVFTILTAVRESNAREMTWDEIGNDLWTIPPERMKEGFKNGQHLIPLPSQALTIIKQMRALNYGSPFVFPNPEGKSYSPNRLREFRVNLHDEEVVAGREGWLDTTNVDKTGRPRIATLHGLARACFETWAHETEAADSRIIDLVLHHSVASYNGAYDNATNIERKRKLLQQWADFIMSKCQNLYHI